MGERVRESARTDAAPARKPHLYEADFLRSVTALAVVAVHVTSFTVGLNQSQGGIQTQDAVVTLLHFTREIFLSITALVLVYSYANRPFSVRAFWRKRSIGVLLPYVLWSLLYAALNLPHDSALSWLRGALLAILTGSASFQLYFILLSLEVYLVLPVLLRPLVRLGRHPWRLLGGSFALQIALLFVDFHFIQVGPFASTRLGVFINTYQDRFLPLYQLPIVLGVLTALYIEPLRAFVLRHRGWVVAGAVFGVAIYLGHYVVAVRLQHQRVDYESSVFQPTMALYATTLSLLLFWIGAAWVARRSPGQPPPGYRGWRLLSDASFGIYLVHPLILVPVVNHLTPALPSGWPVAARVFLTWLIVAGGSVLLAIVLLYMPVGSRLVGRSRLSLRRRDGATETAPEELPRDPNRTVRRAPLPQQGKVHERIRG